ncbi:MAG: hypothetical protein HFK10_07170 [Clostridia bacterium]|nr:hypothetical protein [Clostridia bacterium]
MKEYKGKRQFYIVMIVFGLLIFAVTILCLFLLTMTSRLLEAMLIGVFMGVGSISIFIVGLSNAIYSHKTVIRVYSDKIEFLNAGKLFNTRWQTVTFSQIKQFIVTRNGYIKYKKKPKYVNLKSGDIHFLFGEKGYCWVDVEDCFAVGKEIIAHLDDSQIGTESELKK